MIKRTIFFYFILFVPFIMFSQEAKEKEKMIELEEVVVTATQTLRELSSLPLPAQIISEEELKKSNAVRLVDILNEQTGLVAVPDYGGGEGIQLQGMDSQYTLILIDGAPLVGRSAGTLDLNRISVGNIKQIEVVKGASSCLYGNEALGGVINIITKKPKKGFKGNAYLQINSLLSTDIGTTLNYKNKKLGLEFFANYFDNKGYDLDESDDIKTVDPYVNNTFSGKVSYDLSNQTNLLATARYYHQNQEVDIKTSSGENATGKGVVDEWNSQLKLNHQFSDKWDSFLEFYATKYSTNEHYKTKEKTISENDFNQLLVKPEFRLIYSPNKKREAVLGVGVTHEALDKSYYLDVPNFDAFYSYLQYDMNFLEKLNVIAGVRFDTHSEYKSQLSPKLAVLYRISPKLNIKSSVGYGFKTPDFRQLYNNFTNAAIGYTVLGYKSVNQRLVELQNEGQILKIDVPVDNFNNTLLPESSVAFNIGLNLNLDSKIKMDINFFRNNIKNLIDTYAIATKVNNQKVFSYQNINKIYTQGVEANFNYKINENLKVFAGYQFLLAKDKEAERDFENGEVFTRHNGEVKKLSSSDYFGLLNRSKHMANFKVFYEIPQWGLDFNIRATYRSKFGLYDTDGNSYLDKYDDFIKGHMLWNVAINKKINKTFELSLGVNNAFDYTNLEITNIPGRTFYSKLFVQF